MEVMYENWYVCLADRWWIIALTVLASSISIIAADYLGINKPWPLSVVLGGILSFMVMEAYPYAWTLGNFAHVILWVIFSCMTYMLPQLVEQSTDHTRRTIWDYFEEVDTAESLEHEELQEGATPWVEYL